MASIQTEELTNTNTDTNTDKEDDGRRVQPRRSEKDHSPKISNLLLTHPKSQRHASQTMAQHGRSSSILVQR